MAVLLQSVTGFPLTSLFWSFLIPVTPKEPGFLSQPSLLRTASPHQSILDCFSAWSRHHSQTLPPKERNSQAGVPFSRQKCSNMLCLLHVWTLTFLVCHSSSNTTTTGFTVALPVFSRTINPGLRVSQVSIMLLEPEPRDTIQTFKGGYRRRHFPGEPWEGMLGSFIASSLGAITFLRLHGSLRIPVQ